MGKNIYLTDAERYFIVAAIEGMAGERTMEYIAKIYGDCRTMDEMQDRITRKLED